MTEQQHQEEERMARQTEWSAELLSWISVAYPEVFHHVLSLYGDSQLADEVTGDALSRAWQQGQGRPGLFDSPAHLLNWTKQTARWEAVNQLRRRGRLRPLPEGDGADDNPARRPLEAGGPGPREQERQLVWDSLQSLPPAERAILEGHYYEGNTDVELGTRLYGDRGTAQARGLRVWRLRQRAEQHLARLLRRGGLGPNEARPPQATPVRSRPSPNVPARPDPSSFLALV